MAGGTKHFCHTRQKWMNNKCGNKHVTSCMPSCSTFVLYPQESQKILAGIIAQPWRGEAISSYIDTQVGYEVLDAVGVVCPQEPHQPASLGG